MLKELGIKKFKPVTPSLRHTIRIIKPKNTIKSKTYNSRNKLIKGRIIKRGGRNNNGRITIRHRGGGHKQRYRILDNKRHIGKGDIAYVKRIEYNPSITGHIALLETYSLYPEGANLTQTTYNWYILASNNLKIGDEIKGEWIKRENIVDNIGEAESLKLKNINVGSIVYNIDGRYIKAAGTKGIILSQLENKSVVRLPSGHILTIDNNVKASIGQVSNIHKNKEIKGKAGVNRWLGIRPTVRGEAMNPVDHPHGGKSHGSGGLGNAPRTKWGKLARKTSSKKS